LRALADFFGDVLQNALEIVDKKGVSYYFTENAPDGGIFVVSKHKNC